MAPVTQAIGAAAVPTASAVRPTRGSSSRGQQRAPASAAVPSFAGLRRSAVPEPMPIYQVQNPSSLPL